MKYLDVYLFSRIGSNSIKDVRYFVLRWQSLISDNSRPRQLSGEFLTLTSHWPLQRHQNAKVSQSLHHGRLIPKTRLIHWHLQNALIMETAHFLDSSSKFDAIFLQFYLNICVLFLNFISYYYLN